MNREHRKYKDRKHAGRVLADELNVNDFTDRPLVLAIPNGGIPVGVQIAHALDAELDAIIVRKMQVPWNPEAGFGAMTSQGSVILNDSLVSRLGLDRKQIDIAIEKTQAQIEKRKTDYRGLVGVMSATDKDLIMVDDGLASGYTMLAAIESVKKHRPKSIIVAVPTAPKRTIHIVQEEVDGIFCPRIETGQVFAVANAYENWYDVPDDEVVDILTEFR